VILGLRGAHAAARFHYAVCLKTSQFVSIVALSQSEPSVVQTYVKSAIHLRLRQRLFAFELRRWEAQLGPTSSSQIVSPVTHRGGRVIGTDALRISVLLHVSSDNQEREQGREDNPNVNSHQSSPAAAGTFGKVYLPHIGYRHGERSALGAHFASPNDDTRRPDCLAVDAGLIEPVSTGQIPVYQGKEPGIL
jgi:hypothetical protein